MGRPTASFEELPAEVVASKGQSRLEWLATQLGAEDALLRSRLASTRRMISIVNADIVIVTVTDEETRAIRASIEGEDYLRHGRSWAL